MSSHVLSSSVLPSTVLAHPLLRIAGDLSAIAWRQMEEWGQSLGARFDAGVVDTKTSANDLVTQADAQIESLVRGFLDQVRPDDLMVGEEGAAALDPVAFFDEEFLRTLDCYDASTGSLVPVPVEDRVPEVGLEWHVDPIDGTVNYVRGIEHFAFSVGVCRSNLAEGVTDIAVDGSGGGSTGRDEAPVTDLDAVSRPGAGSVRNVGAGQWLFGLVASPGLDSTWLAIAGAGAFKVDGRLGAQRSTEAVAARRLHGTPEGLSGRILATGFAYKGDTRAPQLAKLFDLMSDYDDIRRCGSAAIDLCMVAEGKINCYAERGLGIYDYAAGALIAEESGAYVRRGGTGGATAAADSAEELERLIATI
ncbi:myo-inositol-1(or 4)-monophosphatase [Brevibacterium sanguinis]|uniref:inositol-phosphate phosphatase n=2 Tax=Brevibacterium TaxID=1696 RepID=A0A366IJ22_9MICO|nr:MULTISPECIES: inositol monophosphatase family protein [Brevibacterium]RBP62217.1 myo-inositol-1(or 4)-monophosphatase [Brevibacterium sanguinis]RBP70651.1 myo-inositol-1(or 4)-monophosphatase [Brevibacterium celere]